MKTKPKSKRRTTSEAPRWASGERVTPRGMWQAMFEIRDGDAHPGDVRASLLTIHTALDADLTLTREMRAFLREGLERFAGKGRLTLDQAFGLQRTKRGTPRLANEVRWEIAAAVLQEYLAGKSLQVAAEFAGHQFGIGATEARRHWTENKDMASALLSSKRKNIPWKPRELARYEKLMRRDREKLDAFLEREGRPRRKIPKD